MSIRAILFILKIDPTMMIDIVIAISVIRFFELIFMSTEFDTGTNVNHSLNLTKTTDISRVMATDII
jgi:hypothetical protein